MLGRALPNGNAFVGSAIFPKLPSLYGFLQNKPIKDVGSTTGLPLCNEPKDQQSNYLSEN